MFVPSAQHQRLQLETCNDPCLCTLRPKRYLINTHGAYMTNMSDQTRTRSCTWIAVLAGGLSDGVQLLSPSAFLICRCRRCCWAAVMSVGQQGVSRIPKGVRERGCRRTWVVVVAGGLRDGVQLLAQRILDLQAPPLLLCGRGQHQGGHQV